VHFGAPGLPRRRHSTCRIIGARWPPRLPRRQPDGYLPLRRSGSAPLDGVRPRTRDPRRDLGPKHGREPEAWPPTLQPGHSTSKLTSTAIAHRTANRNTQRRSGHNGVPRGVTEEVAACDRARRDAATARTRCCRMTHGCHRESARVAPLGQRYQIGVAIGLFGGCPGFCSSSHACSCSRIGPARCRRSRRCAFVLASP
jgi:hypothetical protein